MFDIASFLNASCETAKKALVKSYLDFASNKIADMIETGSPMMMDEAKEQFTHIFEATGLYTAYSFLFVCPEFVEKVTAEVIEGNRMSIWGLSHKQFKNAQDAWFVSRKEFFNIVSEGNHTVGYEAKSAEQLNEQAVQYASDTWAVWVEKMAAKLDGMNVNALETIGNDPLENTMIAECVNGLRFTVNNSIELVINEKGTIFNRFPCRFSTPMLDGKKVKGASSQKAIKELANA